MVHRGWTGQRAAGLDDAGATTTTLNYDPWGTPEGSTQPGTFGFAGELHDAGIGLVNLRARWYRPGQGRFLARDPFDGFDTEPSSLQPYQYAANDPVLRTDPTGQFSISVDPLARVVAEARFFQNSQDGLTVDEIQAHTRDVLAAITITSDNTSASPSPLTSDSPPAPVNGTNPDDGVFTEQGVTTGTGTDPGGLIRKFKRYILVVGEHPSYQYSMNLAKLHPTWYVLGTTLGSLGQVPRLLPELSGYRNLQRMTNVDATQLEQYYSYYVSDKVQVHVTEREGAELGGMFARVSWDAIIFNNPHILESNDAQTERSTLRLIGNYRRSAYQVGRTAFADAAIIATVTSALLDKYANIRSYFATTQWSQRRFGKSPYFAPFVPHYTNGNPFDWYKEDPNRAAALWEFTDYTGHDPWAQ
jgi:RHS repeat-associated protein